MSGNLGSVANGQPHAMSFSRLYLPGRPTSMRTSQDDVGGSAPTAVTTAWPGSLSATCTRASIRAIGSLQTFVAVPHYKPRQGSASRRRSRPPREAVAE